MTCPIRPVGQKYRGRPAPRKTYVVELAGEAAAEALLEFLPTVVAIFAGEDVLGFGKSRFEHAG
jgi:hypothetical protein